MSYREIKDVFINGRCLEDILNNGKDVDLSGANLDSVDLRYVNLSNANLFGVNLSNANLSNVSLFNADLSYANLENANLANANLIFANLRNSNLVNTNLECADLSCANLSDAELIHVNLKNVNYNHLTSFYSLQCPEEGSFIGYKVADGKVVKLMITEDAKRSSGTDRKCRCDKAKVLSITSTDGSTNYEEAISDYDDTFIYRVGEIVKVDNFDEDRWKVCATGIHFFITRDEAIKYS